MSSGEDHRRFVADAVKRYAAKYGEEFKGRPKEELRARMKSYLEASNESEKALVAAARSVAAIGQARQALLALELDADSVETALFLSGLSLEQAANDYNAHQIFLFALGDAEKTLFPEVK